MRERFRNRALFLDSIEYFVDRAKLHTLSEIALRLNTLAFDGEIGTAESPFIFISDLSEKIQWSVMFYIWIFLQVRRNATLLYWTEYGNPLAP